MIKCIILDHDGAVIDLLPYHFLAWQKAFNKFGLDLTVEQFKEKMDDYLREQSARNVLPDKDEVFIQRLADLKQIYYINDIDKRPPETLPHFMVTVNNLRQAGYKIGVAGSSKNTVFILEKMGIISQFDTIVDRYDFTDPKPAPDIYHVAIDHLGCAPQDSVIVDDSVRGVTAAQQTGAKVVAITTTHPAERLKTLNPDAVIDSLSELTPDFIKSLGK